MRRSAAAATGSQSPARFRKPEMQVLIVEDDRAIAENIYDYLEAAGHQCDYAMTLAAAKRQLATQTFDVLVLDRNLPDGDGATLARSLRAAGEIVPILMLTARDTLEDKLLGFDAGADDYLAKPFALQELAARLQVLARRSQVRPAGADAFSCGPLRYDATAQQVWLDSRLLSLPPKAQRLLTSLMPHPGRLFSRRELELAVWGREQEASDNLRSVLLTLRKALAGSGVEIENVHGLGYKLVIA